MGKIQSINALIITQNETSKKEVDITNFLVQDGELAIIKYGKILQSILKELNNNKD